MSAVLVSASLIQAASLTIRTPKITGLEKVISGILFKNHVMRCMTEHYFPDIMPKSPKSEILAKIFADMGEKCGEKMAKIFADFRPSISRKSGRKKFHGKKNWRLIRLAVK